MGEISPSSNSIGSNDPRQWLFPRGSGPLVSVLLPTRKRIERLLRSLDSLISLAHNPIQIEFLIKVDDDDQETLAALQGVAPLIPTSLQAIISPRGGGYSDMHIWYNVLAAHALGDWLLIWNDDALMKTEKWDAVLAGMVLDPAIWHGVRDICCMAPSFNGELGCTALFFLRRKVTQLLGRLSAIPHCDTWVSQMMLSINSLFYIHHIDVTHQHEEDQVFKEGEATRTSSQYTIHNKGGTLQRLRDAILLQTYIDDHRSM